MRTLNIVAALMIVVAVIGLVANSTVMIFYIPAGLAVLALVIGLFLFSRERKKKLPR